MSAGRNGHGQNGDGARDLKSTAHRVSQRVPDESRCAAFCEVVHARGRGEDDQSVCELCDGDDRVQAPQAPAHSWAFVHQHRPGKYAGRLVRGHVHAHSGPPPSYACNLPRRVSTRRLVVAVASGPQAAAARRTDTGGSAVVPPALLPSLLGQCSMAGHHGSRCMRDGLAAGERDDGSTRTAYARR